MLRDSSKAGGSEPDRVEAGLSARQGGIAGSRTRHCQDPRQGRMATLISDEIIPRLIAAHMPEPSAHRQETAREDAAEKRGLTAEELAEIVLREDAGSLMALIDRAIEDGLPTESLLVDIMAPAARMLGERWLDDTVDFVDVSIGLWRLQEIVHRLSASRADGRGIAHGDHVGRRILCATAPGDDHSFGSIMLEELFHRDGWTTCALRGTDRSELIAHVAGHSYDIIALTVSTHVDSDTLANLLRALRSSSRNPGVSIMVGGYMFNEHPGLAVAVGADATAPNARSALRKAEILVGQSLVRQMADGTGAAGQRQAALRTTVPG